MTGNLSFGYEDLAHKHEELSQEFMQLGERLRQATSSLQQMGLPPSEELIADQELRRRQFEELKHLVMQVTSEAGLISETASETAVGLPYLRSLLDKVEALRAEEARLTRVQDLATAVLQEVSSLTSRDGVLSQPLEECTKWADVLIASLATGASPEQILEAESLAAGEHPLCALLTLVKDFDRLPDGEWNRLKDEVGRTYGTTLAAMAARGRLTLGGSEHREVSDSERDAGDTLLVRQGGPALPRSAAKEAVDAEGQIGTPEPSVSAELEEAEVSAGPALRDVAEPVAAQTVPDVLASEPDRATLDHAASVEFGLCSDQDGDPQDAVPAEPQEHSSADQARPDLQSANSVNLEDGRTLDGAAKCFIAAVPVAKPELTSPQSVTKTPVVLWSASDAGAAAQARRLAALSPPERAEGLVSLLWRLIQEGHTSIAYNLGLTVAGTLPDAPTEIPMAALRALPLVPLVQTAVGRPADILRDCFASLHEQAAGISGRSTPHEDGLRLLLIALTLRPALLAPQTGAASVLRALPLSGEFQQLHLLREAILGYSSLGLELSSSVLKGVRQHAAWAADMEEARDEARRLLASSRLAKIIYAPTTDVWRRWLEDDGPLGQLLSCVIKDQRPAAERVREAVKKWADKNYVDSALSKTDKEIRQRAADMSRIEARAKQAVFKRSQEVVYLASRWLDLLGHEPDAPNDFQYQQADACRSQALSHIQQGHDRLQDLAACGESCLPLAAGAFAAIRALGDLEALFDPDVVAAEPIPAEHALYGDLLRLPGATLDERWEPSGEDPQATQDALLRLIADGDYDWGHAFAVHCKGRNHVATGQIIEVLEAVPEPAQDVAKLREKRNSEIDLCRKALVAAANDAKKNIERAVCYNLLTEDDRNDLRAKLEGVSVSADLNFLPAHQVLERIGDQLVQRQEERVGQVRDRLQAAGLADTAPDAYSRIEKVLATGDFLTAGEYIDRVLEDQALPEDGRREDDFQDFFPKFVTSLSALLEGDDSQANEAGGRRDRRSPQDVRQVVRSIKDGRSIGPVNMRRVPGPQAEGAARMLEAWISLKGRLGVARTNAQNILTGFGFQDVTVNGRVPEAHDREWWADIECSAVLERDSCVVPQYGSLANGRYRLLCVWARPSEDEIVDLAGKHRQDVPLLVLYLGRMSEQRRRSLAEECRRRRRMVLVIDEALVYYLCQERGRRLSTLTRCAFPFTVADPYTTTAGLVPVEMFFGRDRERELILNRYGTNLVYGGRQLGKTALLRDVERRYHSPRDGVLVKYIDLKAEGIGLNRPVSDVWAVLSTQMADNQSTGAAVGPFKQQAASAEAFGKKVQTWLAEDAGRRIVLLLDEADAFLEADSKSQGSPIGQGYAHVAQLGGLSDNTERRFKVVYAGLKNVQRTSRDPNTKIAHLGSPLCIGPLLDNSEWREALALIQSPFETLGYRFESPDLPMRILSHTNYYPSLIQLFCKHLLAYLTNPNKFLFDSKTCPPYMITAKHVEDVYSSEELNREILYRFNLTLDLDRRYRVLAMRIAIESAEGKPDRNLADGFDISWVRKEGLAWWEAGFREDSSQDAFVAILDEMIGLGLLRKVGGVRYALRNPNVLNLLGSQKNILDAFFQAIEKEPDPPYEAASFRRALSDDMWHRSPLTAQQEADLLFPENGTSVVFGAHISGLNDCGTFLRAALTAETFFQVDEAVGVGDLLRRLDEVIMIRARDEGRSNGVMLVMVSPVCPWSAEWVLETQDFLRRKKFGRPFVRVVFVGDPASAWTWCRVDDHIRKRLDAAAIFEHTLKPWTDTAVQRWLIDAGFGPSDLRGRETLARVTGNWGALLHHVGREFQKTSLYQWEQRLEELNTSLMGQPEWRSYFSFQPEALPIFRVMATLNQPLDADEIVSIMSDVPDERVELVLGWADRLSFARQTAHSKWLLDPLVQRVVLDLPE